VIEGSRRKRIKLPSRVQVLELVFAGPDQLPSAHPAVRRHWQSWRVSRFRGSAASGAGNDSRTGDRTLRPAGWPRRNSAWKEPAPGAPVALKDAFIGTVRGPGARERSKREANPGPVPGKEAAAVPRERPHPGATRHY